MVAESNIPQMMSPQAVQRLHNRFARIGTRKDPGESLASRVGSRVPRAKVVQCLGLQNLIEILMIFRYESPRAGR